MQMSTNIANGLSTKFPQHEKTIGENLKSLLKELEKLQNDADIAFSQVNSNKLVTFHDGFSYMADAFHLEILHSIEEESGSEASAAELIEISNIIKNNNIHSIFTERNGSTSAANVIASETGVKIYQLDTGIANGDYFDVMYQNIKVLKEGLQ
jgi:ABC-type Zn uptake system ZnuABC Zn-binding protein ZnuA